MFCPACGAQNDPNAQNCSNCGQPMPQAQTPAPPQPPVAPPAPAPSAPPSPPAYSAAPSQYAQQQPYPAQAVPPMPPNYLWQSIVVTILCCWPLGIPAIVFATQVGAKYGRGDYQGAQNASKSAKMWMIIALVAGLVGSVLYIGLTVLGVLADMGSSF